MTTTAPHMPPHNNRLAKETSPYLLQHQHNPVDWYAWGPGAFEAARKADKPIFLSIGYSTCYWCHVMERESFENEATAKVMNENFICIKVDREERPDVDDIYMTAVQLMSGSGGWPMSVFLEPKDLKPFMAGTYFPPKDAFGRPSFTTVLTQMRKAWDIKREDVNKQADTLANAIRESMAEVSDPVAVGQREVDLAIAGLMAAYDKIDGGFVSGGPTQRAPKFPTPVNLDFLIAAGWNQKEVKSAVLHTLDRMAIGGMYDQVGGGFHRYSVDEEWLVPHFEKMLYDQGQLVSTYARAYELTKDEFYAEVLRETMEYVLRDLTSSEAGGAFLCGQDAEVNAREGQNYLWTADQVRETLTAAGMTGDADFALKAYGMDRGTNFQDPHHPGEAPSNVLFLSAKPAELAGTLGVSVEEFGTKTAAINKVLLAARDKRDQPSTDDKILAGWNGLMIAGFADGGRVLKDPQYVSAAIGAAKFVLTSMRSKDGSLLRSHRAGESRIEAFLEDYALMIKGLLALHRAGGAGDRQWLNEARTLAQTVRAKFWDQSGGGYFDTLDGQSDLFVRVKSTYDGAIPSGNAVMLNNLLDLHDATGQAAYLDDAVATMKFMSAKLSAQPTGCVLSALALDRMVKKHAAKLEKETVPFAAKPAPPTSGSSNTSTAPPAKAPTAANPVTAAISPVEVNLKVGSSATVNITLTVFKGFHINAHQPGDEFLIGVKIDLAGAEGLTITPEYPKGSEYKSEGISENTIFVHEGTVTIPVRIEQTAKMTGSPKFSVTWHACTHEMCHQPKREMLGVRVIAER